MIVGEIVRAVVSYNVTGASASQNAFWWTLSLLPQLDSDVFDAIDNWVENVWAVEWDNHASQDSTLVGVKVDVILPTGFVDRNLGSKTYSITGTATGHILPVAVSGFLQANTANPRRHGRKYVPGPNEGASSNGVYNATFLTYLTNLLTIYLTLIDIGGVANLDPGVLDTVGQLFHLFNNTGLVTNAPSYRRSRKAGVGL